MKKLIWLTTLTVLFVLVFLPGLLSLGLKYLPGNIQPSLDSTRDVYGLYKVTQEFTSLEPRLTGIGMTIKNPNLKNKESVTFTLYNTNGDLLRQVTYSGANIGDGDFVKFIFDPVEDSQNQKYRFQIESPTANVLEVLPVFITTAKPSWLGNFIYNNEVNSGGVSMVAFYKPESKIKVIEEIYSSLFSK